MPLLQSKIDIVITAKNEAFKLQICCRELLKKVPINNLIIVVGESKDNTRALHYGPDIFKRGFGGKRVELGRYQKVFHFTSRSLWNKFIIPIEDIYRYRRSIRR